MCGMIIDYEQFLTIEKQEYIWVGKDLIQIFLGAFAKFRKATINMWK